MKLSAVKLMPFFVLLLFGCQSVIPTDFTGTYFNDTSHYCGNANRIVMTLKSDGSAHEEGVAPGVHDEEGHEFSWEREGSWSKEGLVVTIRFPGEKPLVLKAEIYEGERYKGRFALATYPYNPILKRKLQARFIRVREE